MIALSTFTRAESRRELHIMKPMLDLVEEWNAESSEAGETSHTRGTYVAQWAERMNRFTAASALR